MDGVDIDIVRHVRHTWLAAIVASIWSRGAFVENSARTVRIRRMSSFGNVLILVEVVGSEQRSPSASS